MSSFFVFLDDIAVLAKAAAASIDDIAAGAGKAATKCAAVVIDDAAVTPQYVQGISPARELPVVAAIAKRSLVNKAVITAAIMALSAVAPWVFPWALIAGGCYLTFEGAEKIIHAIRHDETHEVQEVVERTPADERTIIRSAATTDFVLSVEIMLIAVDALDFGQWQLRLAALIAVAILMTLLVYGSVGLLVKIDDAGRAVAQRGAAKGSLALQAFGTGLVKLMPKIFALLTVVGVAAMLWVGGHLLIANLAHVGFPLLETFVHDLTGSIGNAALLWLADTALSAAFGLVFGAVIAGIVLGVKSIAGLLRP